jgi:hypothetical protein
LSTAFGKETRLIHDIPHATRIKENKLCVAEEQKVKNALPMSPYLLSRTAMNLTRVFFFLLLPQKRKPD